MNRTENIRRSATTPRSTRGEKQELRRLAGRLRTLATEILKRIPDQSCRPTGHSAGTANSEDAQSPRKGYQWPASALTEDDMRSLDHLRSQTRTPIARLVHEAVATFGIFSRTDLAELERLCAQTGRSIRELMSEAVSLLSDRHSRLASGRTPSARNQAELHFAPRSQPRTSASAAITSAPHGTLP